MGFMSGWLHFFPHLGLNNETFQVHHGETNFFHHSATFPAEIFEQFLWFFGWLCSLFLGVLPIRFDHKNKQEKKVPHFTIIEQRQVFWAAQPNEQHYPGSSWRIQEPISSEAAVESSPAAFLRCSTFPCSLPKQACWLTAPTAPA